jgi:hypothetical protein
MKALLRNRIQISLWGNALTRTMWTWRGMQYRFINNIQIYYIFNNKPTANPTLINTALHISSEPVDLFPNKKSGVF